MAGHIEWHLSLFGKSSSDPESIWTKKMGGRRPIAISKKDLLMTWTRRSGLTATSWPKRRALLRSCTRVSVSPFVTLCPTTDRPPRTPKMGWPDCHYGARGLIAFSRSNKSSSSWFWHAFGSWLQVSTSSSRWWRERMSRWKRGRSSRWHGSNRWFLWGVTTHKTLGWEKGKETKSYHWFWRSHRPILMVQRQWCSLVLLLPFYSIVLVSRPPSRKISSHVDDHN